MPADILVVVADRGRARLLSIKQDENELTERTDLINPSLRVHASDLAHERQGRVMNRNCSSRAALGDSHFYKKQSAERFARQVVGTVAATCKLGAFESVFLVTEPEFLGLLRPRLAAVKLGIPIREIPKNITHRSTMTIRGYLPRRLWKHRSGGVWI